MPLPLPPKTFADVEALLAESLPGYEARPQQQLLARTIEESLSSRTNLLAEAGTGCIQGDAEVIINRGGNGRRMTLRTMVERFNHVSGRYQWDPSIPTYIQREHSDGTVRLALVLNAWYSGAKSTFTVTTESGRTLRATAEHPFLTERGWLRLDQIEVGDLVHVRGEQASDRGRQPKPQYLTRSGLVGHPYASRQGAARHPFRRPLHILVAEAEQNGLTLNDFLSLLRTDRAQHLTFLDPAVWAVHHKDHDHRNNEPQNLQILTHSDHHRLHAGEGKTRSVLYKVVTERVVSVEPYGVEDTYDVEVADDPHNFIVNGFVVHNTGKSLGYLIPAILHAVQSGKRTIVSTATKALQDQVANKDLPFLAEHLNDGFLPRPFLHALLKGRSNYLCMAKLNDPESANQPYAARAAGIIANHQSDSDFLGERDDFASLDDSEWRKVTTTSEECPGKSSCPFGEICFAERAKSKAKAADVVVVNHALFLTDLKILMETDGLVSMLDHYDSVIFDEAHEIEEYAGSIFGQRVSEHGIRDTCSKVLNAARRTASEEHQEVVSQTVAEVTRSMTALWPVLQPGRIRLGDIEEHADEFIDFVNALGALDSVVRAPEMMERSETRTRDKALSAMKILIENVSGQYTKVRQIVLEDFAEWVRWSEDETMPRTGEKRRVMRVAPISVAPLLREGLFGDHVDATSVLVSATLSVGGSFEYISDRLGIDSAKTLDVGTPFDYDAQSRLYVPRHLPDPGRERDAWSSMVVAEILDLIRASDGRALVLFTSYRAMKAAYDAVAGRLPYTVLMQGQQSNRDLAAAFAEDTHSVLFATRSFMTGVDFQGDTCSLVIVDKLPFPVPTEALTEARTEAIKARGGNDFGEYTIPVMTLVLKQAFGRLIRHRNDRGVVAILDPRLLSKGYGRKIIQALPDSPLIGSTGEVKQFFESLKEDQS